MPKCKNSGNHYYTGKENSPLGKGFCSHGEEIGKRMKGKDGHIYKVTGTKNGKRWSKIRNMTSPKKITTVPEVHARASAKYARASYRKEGSQYKATVRFSSDLSKVSAIHIHRGKGGKVGPIIAWLATTKKWHETRTKENKNSPCCNPQNNCTLQAPAETINISNVSGKTIEYDIPYPKLGPNCYANKHLKDKDVYLVVHGLKLTYNNLDIIAHTKFN